MVVVTTVGELIVWIMMAVTETFQYLQKLIEVVHKLYILHTSCPVVLNQCTEQNDSI